MAPRNSEILDGPAQDTKRARARRSSGRKCQPLPPSAAASKPSSRASAQSQRSSHTQEASTQQEKKTRSEESVKHNSRCDVTAKCPLLQLFQLFQLNTLYQNHGNYINYCNYINYIIEIIFHFFFLLAGNVKPVLLMTKTQNLNMMMRRIQPQNQDGTKMDCL